MKQLVVGLFLIAGTMLGCAQNYYNVPVENIAAKVKVLGVAPIFIDVNSDIIHPQKELLIPLITDLNRKYEPLLIRKLQATGSFYAVTLLADEPKQLFSSLMARHEKRNDASINYNKYFWKNDAIGSYIKKNHLDAVMVIVVSGLTQTSKIFSSNLLTSLETNYNFLTMTAQIIGPDGTILWEYPNFRGRLLTFPPLVNLQYPDFSESEANLSKKTVVRFKSLDGVRRTLEQKKNDWLFRETTEPEVYGRLFDEMASLVNLDIDKQSKGTSKAEGKTSSQNLETQKPAESPQKAAPATAAPSVKPAVQVPSPETATETPALLPNAPNEIVPATKSTL
ncbi:MAG: hypothetical protein HGB32_07015 [Geobacteraceae bacterium]|nr:hypothetical protein [Geobacteraceae bacterium]NTW79882.1 hypothetical protein [Geobacteraceae bacterium]